MITHLRKVWVRKEKSDAERVMELAHQEDVSEYEIFLRAARVWNRHERSVDWAFSKYLFTDDMPFWVKGYVRQFIK